MQGDGDDDVPTPRQTRIITSGEIAHESGDVYTGEILNGHQMHGKGIYIFSNGDSLNGEFAYDKIINGIHSVPSIGYTFQGTFRNGQRYNGVEKFSNGVTFTGTINLDGTKDGTWKYSDGDIFTGHFLGADGNALLDGPGKIVRPNGTIYEGNFRNGKMHGQGKLTFRSTRGIHRQPCAWPLLSHRRRRHQDASTGCLCSSTDIIKEGIFDNDVFVEEKKVGAGGKRRTPKTVNHRRLKRKYSKRSK